MATGRKNWLFAGTLDGHDPYVYLKDVLERLATQRASDIDQLLPHRWASAA
jgi:hypothetical protein